VLVSALGKRHADLMCVQNPQAHPYRSLDETALSGCALLVDWFLNSLLHDVKTVKQENSATEQAASVALAVTRDKKKKKRTNSSRGTASRKRSRSAEHQ
jgi:hypothetical protein